MAVAPAMAIRDCRNSSFLQGALRGLKQVGRELGVPNVLEGSARKAGAASTSQGSL
jgi:TolB-like protein